ncbi:MAG TPA: riboflavin biosynthesis protein RibF [Candidatus Avoscillospira stercorigallinarum]|uniref:Riboflavin biosynthesis protein n=1 Tax=Candidatus Avoscillospira stercorigallinarum TaxID=2840708 RepID=A0A9D1CNY1_9FIRM|nr:riboflavin biosynthesis protein RibF [Candidatus Avoscillospira stercorigallinarum]
MTQDRVIALGFFDGVHLGHAALLTLARKRANAMGLRAAALTFDTHPDTLVFHQPVPLINTIEDRKWLMETRFGLDEVLVAHFDRAMMEMPWESFVDDYLIGALGAKHVICGHDFSFGYRGQGSPARLRRRCSLHGVGVDVVDKVVRGGVTISSTHIRQLIRQGDLEGAAQLLGHCHFLSGPVAHGKELGRRLGFPTANLPLPAGILAPAFGVYAAKVTLPNGASYPAVTNVGIRPTVHDSLGPLVEAWIMDYDGQLYGETIRVDFYTRLRGEQKFPDLESLKAEVLRNAQQTRSYFQHL